jgi:hypothetical protein
MAFVVVRAELGEASTAYEGIREFLKSILDTVYT